jgi:hypothetical protein
LHRIPRELRTEKFALCLGEASPSLMFPNSDLKWHRRGYQAQKGKFLGEVERSQGIIN